MWKNGVCDHSTAIDAPEYVVRGLMNLSEAIALRDPNGIDAQGSVSYGRNFRNRSFRMRQEDWNGGDNTTNFRYGNFAVTWYKHIGRSTCMNREISEESARAPVCALHRIAWPYPTPPSAGLFYVASRTVLELHHVAVCDDMFLSLRPDKAPLARSSPGTLPLPRVTLGTGAL